MKSYIIFGQDNSKYAYENNAVSKCPDCGLIDRHNSARCTFTSLPFDVSCTFDNELLVSERIAQILIYLGHSSDMKQAGSYYYIMPNSQVGFDAKRRGTRYGATCSKCGTPEFVVGITPAFLSEGVTKSGIYRTDICFGDKNDYVPTLVPAHIITEDILNVLLEARPSGFDYQEVKE